jgi:uncharacterized OsmC-like protein
MTDMSKDDGGGDQGFEPIQLLAGSLCSCVAMTIQIYCEYHKIPSHGIEVNAVVTLADKPKRIQNIAMDVKLPEGFPEEKRDRVERVARKCPVHNTIMNAPDIDFEFL